MGGLKKILIGIVLLVSLVTLFFIYKSAVYGSIDGTDPDTEGTKLYHEYYETYVDDDKKASDKLQHQIAVLKKYEVLDVYEQVALDNLNKKLNAYNFTIKVNEKESQKLEDLTSKNEITDNERKKIAAYEISKRQLPMLRDSVKSIESAIEAQKKNVDKAKELVANPSEDKLMNYLEGSGLIIKTAGGKEVAYKKMGHRVKAVNDSRIYANANTFSSFATIMMIVATAIALLFFLFVLVTRTPQNIRLLISIVLFGLIMLITYMAASSPSNSLAQATGASLAITSWAAFFVNGMIILLVILLLVIVADIVLSALRKR